MLKSEKFMVLVTIQLENGLNKYLKYEQKIIK